MSKLYLSATTDAIKTARTARGHHWAEAHVRGWTAGVRVKVYRIDENTENPRIKFEVYKTTGSNGDGVDKIAAQWIVVE